MKKIITLSHQKGGVGKSTLAYLIALEFRKHTSVALLDIDPQGTLRQINTEKTAVYTYDQIDSIKEDILIIDTPPYLSDKLLDIFKRSDLIIIPTRAGIADLLAIRSTINLLKETGTINKGLIVLNMIKPNTTLTETIVKTIQSFSCSLSDVLIPDRVAITRAFLTPISDKKIEEDLKKLFNEILLKLNL